MMTQSEYYHCNNCDIELHDEDVRLVVYRYSYANGEHGACPDCGRISPVYRPND